MAYRCAPDAAEPARATRAISSDSVASGNGTEQAQWGPSDTCGTGIVPSAPEGVNERLGQRSSPNRSRSTLPTRILRDDLTPSPSPARRGAGGEVISQKRPSFSPERTSGTEEGHAMHVQELFSLQGRV